jgi:hypothetical protein
MRPVTLLATLFATLALSNPVEEERQARVDTKCQCPVF